MVNYLHLSSNDDEKGISEQRRMFQRLMGTERSWENLMGEPEQAS